MSLASLAASQSPQRLAEPGRSLHGVLDPAPSRANSVRLDAHREDPAVAVDDLSPLGGHLDFRLHLPAAPREPLVVVKDLQVDEAADHRRDAKRKSPGEDAEAGRHGGTPGARVLWLCHDRP